MNFKPKSARSECQPDYVCVTVAIDVVGDTRVAFVSDRICGNMEDMIEISTKTVLISMYDLYYL